MTDPAMALDPGSLRGLSEDALDERLRAFANEHGAGALPALSGLAESSADRSVRRAAKRALYRLSQRGLAPAPAPPAAPVVRRGTPHAVRAWLSGIDGSGAPAGPPPIPAADPALADRSLELLGLPEMAGWFLDPESVQSDALEVQEARESRLVVSDQIKAERQEAILGRVIEREFTPEGRRRWGRRFAEMAWIFDATDRGEHAAIAAAAAAVFAESEASFARHPIVRALAQRALELASEVAAGRLRAADVSRKP